MPEFKRINKTDIAFFESILPKERVLTGDSISEDFSRDEMTEYGTFAPGVVLTVMSAREVSDILRYCNEQGIPVTPRGAGTGLCGGCVAIYGGVLLDVSQMKRLIEIDKVNMTATVEPGLMLMEFQKLL